MVNMCFLKAHLKFKYIGIHFVWQVGSGNQFHTCLQSKPTPFLLPPKVRSLWKCEPWYSLFQCCTLMMRNITCMLYACQKKIRTLLHSYAFCKFLQLFFSLMVFFSFASPMIDLDLLNQYISEKVWPIKMKKVIPVRNLTHAWYFLLPWCFIFDR